MDPTRTDPPELPRCSAPRPPLDPPRDDGTEAVEEHLPLVPLPLGLRITLFVVGWLLVLVGVAGLVLPGLQGVLTLLAGAAVLSLVSELAYRWLRAALSRWPRLWVRIEGFRRNLHRRLHRQDPPRAGDG